MNEPPPIRVLQIIDTLGMGGAETWLMEVLRLWSKSGACHMDFLLTSGNRGIFDDEARQLGANLHYLRYGRKNLLTFAKEFRWILRTGQYDAIHDHQAYASGWHFLLGGHLLPRVRLTHVHNSSYQIRNDYGVTVSRRMVAAAGKRLIAHTATQITGTSRQILTEYGFDDPLFRHIPKAALYCGFESTRFLGDASDAKRSLCGEFGWPADAKIILFAGRMDASPDLSHPQNQKNSGFAVNVGIECLRRDARVRMLFAGKSSIAVPVLEQRIAAAGVTGRIKFSGIRNDIERLMLGSDVLLFPSRAEGLGMVVVEAQAAGLPVLASDVVPRECVVIPELVHFRTVKAGQEAQWAADLLALAEQPRNIPEANRRVKMSVFSIENSASALVELYGSGRHLPASASQSKYLN